MAGNFSYGDVRFKTTNSQENYSSLKKRANGVAASQLKKNKHTSSLVILRLVDQPTQKKKKTLSLVDRDRSRRKKH